MRFSVVSDLGDTVDFECADTLVSRWVCGAILEGSTYPCLQGVDDVHVVVDVGANCGATSVYFARHYPDAAVHALEPATEPRTILERNAASYPQIRVHGVGLSDGDRVVPLYHGDDSILGSVHRRSVNLDVSEPVQLRHGGAWAADAGIDAVDVLKVDVEGCEVEVLSSLADLLPTVQVLYVEYDSREARREIDALTSGSHVLYSSLAFLDQGECTYVRSDTAARVPATPSLGLDLPRLPFVDAEAVTVDPEAVRRLGPDTARHEALVVEWSGDAARREVDLALAPTHELLLGFVGLAGGRALYLRADAADSDEVKPFLLGLFSEWREAQAGAAAREGSP